MTLDLRRSVGAAGLALVCAVWPATAQSANITASETANDIATLVGTQFDVTAFTSTSSGESADASGAFIANSPATGQALVVLTEGPGGPNSDWLQLVYTNNGSTVNMTVHWRSDSDPGGLPGLPTGVTPVFLTETGAVQDVTAQLVSSATASGFAFPSNLTVQVQSDIDVVPEPASLTLLSVGAAWLGGRGIFRRRKRA